jgi:NADH-quinone oxidoreductase subunit N
MLENINWILPEVFLAITATVLLGYGTILSKLGSQVSQLTKINWLTIITLLFSAVLLIEQLGFVSSNQVLVGGGFLVANEFIIGIKLILVLSSALVLILGLKSQVEDKMLDYEFSQLILLSTLGMMLLVGSGDLIMLYLAIELLSLSFYVLASIKRHSQHSTEAGLKYFLLGALSSGLLLFGMALVYAFTGATSFVAISEFLWYSSSSTEILIGVTFIIIALLFKLAAAPFHMWAPDVYEGSPTIVTAFFAIVPKIGTLGVLILLLTGPFLSLFNELQPILLFSACLSLIVGSVGALNQAKMKRLLAYSAISHIGFLLVGLLPNSLLGIHACFVYICLYIVMSFNTFAFVLANFRHGNFITQLSGLSRQNPILAFTFAFTLLSIAGVPPLAGFYSKYLVLLQAVNNEFFGVALIGIICSCIAGFYYLRIIRWMFFKHDLTFHLKDIGDALYPSNTNVSVSLVQSLILGSTLFIILTFLVYPTPFLTFSQSIIFSSLI